MILQFIILNILFSFAVDCSNFVRVLMVMSAIALIALSIIFYLPLAIFKDLSHFNNALYSVLIVSATLFYKDKNAMQML